MARLAGMGLLVGLALGAAGARYLKPYLFGVAPWDIRSLGFTLIMAVLLALTGAVLPAHRASRVAPAIALKHE
jgi:ABC-type lipoprotein release transport system permease subunit